MLELYANFTLLLLKGTSRQDITGPVAGGIVGGVVAITVVTVVVIFVIRRKGKPNERLHLSKVLLNSRLTVKKKFDQFLNRGHLLMLKRNMY